MGSRQVVFIPFPPKDLNPNKHKHWAAKDGHRKKYRADCLNVASQVSPSFIDARIGVRVMFYPPDNRGRDIDNMLASIKAGIDGICEAWGINDKLLRPIVLDVGDSDKIDPRVELTFIQQ